MYDEMMKYVLESLEKLIVKYDLTVKKQKVGTLGFSIDLENINDFIHIYYGTYPCDSPYAFDVRYCKQKFINKNFVLYKTDTKEITTLWRYDTALNTKITGNFKKDVPVISECCIKVIDMFTCFQAMSDDEYYEVSEKLKRIK